MCDLYHVGKMLAEQQEKLFVSELRRGFVFPLFAFQYPLSTTSDQIIHLINFLRDMFTSCKTSSSSYGNKYSSSAFSNIFLSYCRRHSVIKSSGRY